VKPLQGVIPKEYQTIQTCPEEPLNTLLEVNLYPPKVWRDRWRVTCEWLDKLNMNASGFLWPEEVRCIEYMLLQNEKSITFDESNEGNSVMSIFLSTKLLWFLTSHGNINLILYHLHCKNK
jgi:hypothetical protein